MEKPLPFERTIKPFTFFPAFGLSFGNEIIDQSLAIGKDKVQ